MKNKALCAALSAALLLSLAVGCGKTEEVETDTSTPVEVQTVERGNMATQNQVTGKIVSGNEYDVFPQTQAEYLSVNVEVGDSVSQGQLLASLDVSAQAKSLAETRASYNTTSSTYANTKAMYDSQIAMAEKTLADTQALFEVGAASQLAVDQAELALSNLRSAATTALNQCQTSLNTMSASIATLSDSVSKGSVTAPISGIVTRVDAKRGAFASPSAVAVTIAELDYLQVETSISESLAPKVAIGDSVDVTISALNKTVTGTVSELDPAASNALYNVTVDLPSDCGASSGMSASVIFYTDTSNDTVMIPTDVIITSGSEQYVFTVDSENLAHKVVITTGLNSSGTCEVLTGLNGGETLVVSGQNYLSEGSEVRIVE